MLACVRCGACLTSCPTYVLSLNESDGPRGRIAMMRCLAEGRLDLTADLVEHEMNCLVCDACTAVCPAGIHMGPMQVAFRSAIESHLRRPGWQRVGRRFMYRQVFGDLARLRLLVDALRLYRRSGLQWLARRLGILKLLGLARMEALLPPLSGAPLVPRGERYPADARGDGAATEVAFFAGCVMSTALADVDRATIRVLVRAGCDVDDTAGQGCCGALNAHAGDLEGALAMARQNIEVFERAGDVPIVVNSAGCGAMLKDYAHHFRDDPVWRDRARAFSARVQDVTELLAGRDLPMRRAISARVVYQDACHLVHAQHISQPPRALLRAIPGLDLAEMVEPGLCCGSAGIYNLTNPDESSQLRERKLDNVCKTGATIVATANPGCLLQLQSGARERGDTVKVKHLVELLDEATAP